MEKLLLTLFAAAAISMGIEINASAEALNEDINNEPILLDIIQPAPAKPTNSAEAAVKETIYVKEIIVDATAYTAECEGCSGKTKLGVDLKANPEAKVIAVDPAIIPLGSEVYVEDYGYATAADIGGGINGHEIDVFIPQEDAAVDWGRKQVKVTIVEN